MELKNFVLSPYGEDSYVLKGVERQRYTILSDYQAELFQQLLAQKHPLFIFFPTSGIATLSHFREAFGLMRKLLDLGLPAAVKRSSESEISKVGTARLEGMHAFATLLTSWWTKLAGKIPSGIWVVLVAFVGSFGLASYAWLYELVSTSDKDFGFPVLSTLLASYGLISLSLSWQALVAAGFLRARGREVQRPRFEFWGPFFALAVDGRDIWLEGQRARAALAFLQAMAPLSLVGLFNLLNLLTPLAPRTAMILSFPCLVTSLLLLCPLHRRGAGAELLHCLLVPHQLEENWTSWIWNSSFYRNGKSVAFFVLAMVFWSFVWTDVWHAMMSLLLPTFIDQIYFNFDPGVVFFIKTGLQLLHLGLAYPFLLVVYHLVSYRARETKAEEVTQVNRQPLTYQEQTAALAKIPLFVSLSELAAKELFQQMETRFFPDGERLVKQGDVGDEFFVLVRGKALAESRDRLGQLVMSAEILEGDAFGEVALLDDVPRTASVYSFGGCYAVILKKKAFQEFVERQGSIEQVKQTIRLTSFLKKHPLFLRLAAEDLLKVIETLQYEMFAPREKVPHAATQENFYLVYNGKLSIAATDTDIEQVLSVEDGFGFTPLSPQGVAGEISALDGASVLRIPKAVFLESVWDRFLNQQDLLWSR